MKPRSTTNNLVRRGRGGWVSGDLWEVKASVLEKNISHTPRQVNIPDTTSRKLLDIKYSILQRTRIVSGIQSTTHFIEFFIVETNRFVGIYLNCFYYWKQNVRTIDWGSMCSNPCESEFTCFRPESNLGHDGLLSFFSATLSTTELWWRMNHRKSSSTVNVILTRQTCGQRSSGLRKANAER